MLDRALIRRRVDEVRERITRAGGDLDRVRIVAVTKGFDVDAVRTALDVGLTDVGENYAQEARTKHTELASADAPEPTWHFIGHLQRNKVRSLAPFVDVWQSLDSKSLIDEVALRAPGASVFVQVNLSGEGRRGGCDWADVDALVDIAREARLDVRGLMGIAPLGAPEDARSRFRRLARTAERLGLDEISMGMSADLEVAVQEGATIVRVGSSFFGHRPLRASASH